MKINVAGAGAGKTTKMADLMVNQNIPEGKVVFCIAFTNAAADNIKEKVSFQLGKVPNNIKISTIHSFLFQELIEPYYYFLYGTHFKKLSTISLPMDNAFKMKKISELEKEGILHVSKIPEKAKWIVFQKTGDKKEQKLIRQKILMRFKGYCSAIYVDEAQDISEEISIILQSLEKAGVDIVLYGDPKQDVKGYGCFRHLIDSANDVDYISECYRCPQKHLDITNALVSDKEKQTANANNAVGRITIVFETDLKDVNEHIKKNNYDLCYISQKQANYYTHNESNREKRFETLRYEVNRAMAEKWDGNVIPIEIERVAFSITEKMLKSFDLGKDIGAVINSWIRQGAFDPLEPKRYAQMANAFEQKESFLSDAIVVKSIEIVKGLEGEKCLFILTSDLAPYLLGIKTEDNKTSHLLYVALTRSKDQLTIMITNGVEKAYTREYLLDFFKNITCNPYV